MIYHDRWQGKFQPLLRQVPNEDGEVSADASAEGKEEEDKDGDGDVEEEAAGGWQIRVVGVEVFQTCAVPRDVDDAGKHGNGWEEEVVDGHGGGARNQDCTCDDQKDFLTHQSGEK